MNRFIQNNKQLHHELNLLPKIKEFCNCLNTWKKHKLSLIGKVMVIKTFALPKLIYPLTVLETPPIDNINIIKKHTRAYQKVRGLFQ